MKRELLENVKSDIRDACQRAGRKPEEVTLIAVSKTKPWEDVAEFLTLGQKDFGENYVQEALEKIAAIKSDTKISTVPNWHFIGNLQSNKAKFLPGNFGLFHALDSVSLAQKLSKAAAERKVVMNCLVEVNVDNEASKAGISSGHLPAFLKDILELQNIRILGLMCLPSAANASRAPFAKLRDLLEKTNASNIYPHPLRELSMGMSGDFKEAIMEGATFVRVGTRLFGERTRGKVS
ncbi:MAG: YggS family pyridoxal phosphate-dependent enzyme [Bacteriovoracia bacterium]